MAIHQTKKQTDLEKRLRLLRQQVYGKAEEKNLEVRAESHIPALSAVEGPHPTSSSESLRSDITYLRQDLFKILTLSTLAIGTQLALFFSKHLF